MTFTELKKEQSLNPAAFSMAYNMVLENGVKAVSEGKIPIGCGNNCGGEMAAKAAELATEMAKLTPAGFLALSQRLLDPELGGHDGIPHLVPNGDKDNICPCCGADLNEFGVWGCWEPGDEGQSIDWECGKCGATGDACYSRQFAGHCNVCDKNGDKVPDRV